MPFVSSQKGAEQLDYHPNTLRFWANAGKVDYVLTPSGQRKYDLETLSKSKTAQKKYCYCRVSLSSQKDDLDRQVAFMREQYPEHEIVTDIASGINCNRKGLKKLISQLIAGNVAEVCIAHKDRLARFSFDLIKWLLESLQCEVNRCTK
jgi:putative resolvase